MKFYSVIFFVLSLLFALGCNDVNTTDDSEAPALSKSAQAIVDANNTFAFEFIKEHHRNVADTNYMISPVSLSLALGMAYNGADSVTKAAFENTMHYNDLPMDVNLFNSDLIAGLSSQDEGALMEIANSIWANEQFVINPNFLDENSNYYDAEARSLDFSDPATLALINGWVSDKTHGKIPSILSTISSDAVLYLINALYFNAQWKYSFDEDFTMPGTFLLEDGRRVMVDKMQVTEHFKYLRNDLFSSVVLPYENEKFSMTLLLPQTDKSIDDIIDQLSAEQWRAWQSTYDTEHEVTVALPKFKSKYKKYLNQELVSLGLGNAFDPATADFSRISEEPIFISFVLQKTFIDVNEDGTEASAVTVVAFENTSTGSEPVPISFDLYRPFLYFITDKRTGSICFMGKVGHPIYED